MGKDIVFELIKSMNQAEKRYFRRYSTLHSENKNNKYIELFELIDKSKTYDKNKIQKILCLKHFAQNKKHLMSKLLDSLREYNKGKTIESKSAITAIDIVELQKRGLQKQAKKSLKVAKNLSFKSERHLEHLKLMQMETTLLREETNIRELENHLKKLKAQLNTSIDILQNELEYEQEYLNMVKWNKEIEFVRTKKELEKLQKIILNPIFKNDKKALSSKAKIYYYYIKGICHFFTGNFQKSADNFKCQLSIFEHNPQNKETNPIQYIRCIGNLCLLQTKLEDQDNFITNFKRLEQTPYYSEKIDDYKLYLTSMLRLMNLVQNKHYKQAATLIEERKRTVITSINPSDEWYMEWLYFTFDSVTTYMNLGDYNEALRHLNLYLNKADENLKLDSFCIARVLNLLIHFELDNYDLLEYILVSTKRYLEGRERLLKFENIVLEFIKNSLNVGPNKEQEILFVKLRKDLNKLKTDPFEKHVFQYFDFTNMIDNRIKKHLN